ncbi:MAG: deoxyribose-phosphate aldolase [Tenericutes bacterium GWC2_34_14]|nr:MAG: deoxyribose-phosphate aldolase [Tenericutes bacterium GWA2_35_7]OHE29622.1 MAG: deoxyribose-phosphate aldolase [Tenericutes bacterium GWC2_34_14]OHE34202.1 MAG: deoxyribose-phosphate aldolase [Tenericutes bacterium GWE2_34_108]OHE35533.1 MAG: deoxyribose-phosphate aldolase [Tenericutes bacterium GWF1_35_14]OHE38548.1 MAG: deoxyribose-phosphate aldolase [Tenericutes bacterium GWF2_35_184]OHE41606.1 MAG: deoxyribose-phosphate aldolase [Tenericutes bacterium RIFOXYA12_FULL_35_10]OHE43726
MKLNKMIDHTKLGANVSLEQINKLVDEAKVYDFKSVCVNPIWVNYAKQELKNTDVLVCTVIGFPHGTHQPEVKAFEALEAVKNGADELDMVINVYALKSHQDDLVKKDIEGIVKAGAGRTVKVILETCYLTAEEIERGSKIAVSAGAHFVKTSTGFGTYGARVEDVQLMKKTVGARAEVKASGGVRTYDDAMKMIEAGATRIGTSNGVDIVSQRRDQSDSNTSY